MTDMTVIYITANKMPEQWYKFALGHLLKSTEGYPIISVSRVPMDLGINLIDSEPLSFWNMYCQIAKAAEIATTEYVAVAEDDVLYTRNHFTEFRPSPNTFAYNRSRWSLFSWDNIYCLRQRVSNCVLIAPRIYLIDAANERKAKHPNGVEDRLLGEYGRSKVENRLGVSVRGYTEWWGRNPVVHLNHLTGNDTGHYGRLPNGRVSIKKHGQIQAYDIPYWGKAEDIVKIYNGHS